MRKIEHTHHTCCMHDSHTCIMHSIKIPYKYLWGYPAVCFTRSLNSSIFVRKTASRPRTYTISHQTQSMGYTREILQITAIHIDVEFNMLFK